MGLVVAENAQPDLGKSQDPGGNIFRSNTQFDLQNSTSFTVLSVGNQIDPTRTQGLIEFAASEVPRQHRFRFQRLHQRRLRPQLQPHTHPDATARFIRLHRYPWTLGRGIYPRLSQPRIHSGI